MTLPTTFDPRKTHWTLIVFSIWILFVSSTMVGSQKTCCVPKCGKTRVDNVILHTFPDPEKEKERFKAWMDAVGSSVSQLDHQYIYKNRTVCHEHFEERFLTWSRRLSPAAVPTLLAPGFQVGQAVMRDIRNVEVGTTTVMPRSSSHAADSAVPSTSAGLQVGQVVMEDITNVEVATPTIIPRSSSQAVDSAVPSTSAASRLGTEILHKFPNPDKDPERFRSWVYAVGGDILKLDKHFIFKYRRVCKLHFEPRYQTWSKLLLWNAVPTLQLSDKQITKVEEKHDNEGTEIDDKKPKDKHKNDERPPHQESDKTKKGIKKSQFDDIEYGSTLEFADVMVHDHNDDFICEDTEIIDKTHKWFKCNVCLGDISGFRYVCVQCSDYDMCANCEARGEHPHHYVLRVPSKAHNSESRSLLHTLRRFLGGLPPAHPAAGFTPPHPITTDIKEETVEVQDEDDNDMALEHFTNENPSGLSVVPSSEGTTDNVSDEEIAAEAEEKPLMITNPVMIFKAEEDSTVEETLQQSRSISISTQKITNNGQTFKLVNTLPPIKKEETPHRQIVPKTSPVGFRQYSAKNRVPSQQLADKQGTSTQQSLPVQHLKKKITPQASSNHIVETHKVARLALRQGIGKKRKSAQASSQLKEDTNAMLFNKKLLHQTEKIPKVVISKLASREPAKKPYK